VSYWSDFRMTLKWKRANKTETTNEWLVYRMLGWKKLHARELSRNQSILRCDVILQHDWPSQQCLLHIRVFFGGKTKKPRFDLFMHWPIKQITNTYRIQFSRSYENRSIEDVNIQRQIFSLISLNVHALPKNSTPDENSSWHSMNPWAMWMHFLNDAPLPSSSWLLKLFSSTN